MYYIYFLWSQKDKGFYIGRTKNLERRVKEHIYGVVSSAKSRRPLVLLGYDQCNSLQESIKLEKEWKKGYKREELKKRFYNKIRKGG